MFNGPVSKESLRKQKKEANEYAVKKGGVGKNAFVYESNIERNVIGEGRDKKLSKVKKKTRPAIVSRSLTFELGEYKPCTIVRGNRLSDQ